MTFLVAALVATAPRSGSTLLTSAMRSTGTLGHPEEYLSPGTERAWAEEWGIDWPHERGYDGFADAMFRAGTTGNGVFSVKVFAAHLVYHQFAFFADGRSFATPARSRLIHLRRRDKVRAALSEWKAQQTGQWVLRAGERRVEAPAEPTSSDISRLHQFQHAWDRVWLAARCGEVRSIELFYEDLVLDVGAAVESVSSFVGVDSPRFDDTALPLRLAVPEDEDRIARWVFETGGCGECGHAVRQP